MGYDFINAKSETLSLNAWEFPEYCNLAHNFGWQPMGTVLSDSTAEMYAEQLRDHTPQWTYTFHFKTMDSDGLRYKMLMREKRLSRHELEEIQRNPESQWDMGPGIFRITYKRPFECAKVDIEPPKPVLIKTPEDIRKEWGGEYLTNDYQTFLAEDALNFAKALRRAIKQKSCQNPERLEEVATFFSNGDVDIF